MWTWIFWQAALTRALRTFAQTLLSLWGATAFNIFSADLRQAIGVSLGASVLSVLMSVDRSGPTHAISPAPVPDVVPLPEPVVAAVAQPALVDAPAGVYGCGDSIR
jgi:hypothetical protein